MSKLQTVLDEYLAVRRALGYKLRDPGLLLPTVRGVAEHAGAAYITTDLALKWATQPADARQTWWAKRLGVVRLFAQYCSSYDPRTQVPSPSLLPYPFRRVPPYIYRDQEIRHLLEAARQLPSTVGCVLTPTPHCLAYMLPPVCGPASRCVSIATTSISCMAC